MSTTKQTIKVPMQFEPNGSFKLADATHIAYSREYFDSQNIQQTVDNVEDALEILYNTVMAEPKMAYTKEQLLDEASTTYQIAEYKSKLDGNSKLYLPFAVDTPSIGDFVIQIERKPYGSASAYEYYKTIKLSKAREPVLDLGIITEATDMLYRIKLTDGAGKSAVTPWSRTETILDPTTGEQIEREIRIDYLEFRYSCSNVTFKPTPKDNLTTKIFPWPLESFELSCAVSTGIAGYAYVFYQIIPQNMPGPSAVTVDNIQEWRHQKIIVDTAQNTNYLLSATVTSVDSLNLSFSDPALTGEAGKYNIYCTAVVADCEINFDNLNDSEYRELITFDYSTPVIFAIDALEANSVSVTNQNTWFPTVNTSSIISIKPLAKTNVDLLTKINGLYLRGGLYYKAKTQENASHAMCLNPACEEYKKIDLVASLEQKCNKSDLEYLSAFTQYQYTATVTSGFDAPLWIITRPTIPAEYAEESSAPNFELPCYLQLNVTAATGSIAGVNYLPYFQEFNLTKDVSSTGVVTDRLIYNLDFINQADVSLEDNRLGETVINPNAAEENQYSYGIKLFNTKEGSSGIVTTEADFTYLAFTKNTYGVFYKQQGESTVAFSPWHLLPLNQDTAKTVKDFTIETYFRPHDIGNLNAESLTMALPSEIGASIGRQATIKLQSGAISYPLITDQWQHVVLTINEGVNTTDPTDLNPYPTLRCYINGVLVAAERFPTRKLGSLQLEEAMLDLFGGSQTTPPAIFNGTLDTKTTSTNLDSLPLDDVKISTKSTGACDFKVFRFYNKALSAQEILQNFIATQTDEVARAQIISRNDGNTLAKVYFIANKPITSFTDLPSIDLLNHPDFENAIKSLSEDQQALFTSPLPKEASEEILDLQPDASEDERKQAIANYWRDYFLQEHAKWTSYRSKVDYTKAHNPSAGIFNKTLLKEQYPTTFKTLNSIKTKATEFNASGNVVHGSKTALVNCTMYTQVYSEDGLTSSWTIEPDVDVYLQGTSSLAYPVKNYQIKVYSLDKILKSSYDNKGKQLYTYKRNKKKITPPGRDESSGWLTKDSVYTLKCDYMEHSHRNNTPTARFYQDEVLDYIIAHNNTNITASEMNAWKAAQRNPNKVLSAQEKEAIESTKYKVRSQYSPARSIIKTNIVEGVNITSNVYRDAIDGDPCLVYFCDNDVAGTYVGTSAAQPYSLSGNETYAGSFMFNVDKAGAQLGFEIKINEAIDSGVLPDPNAAGTTEVQKKYFTNVEGKNKLTPDKDTSDETFDCIPCISYEGGANVDDSAGAFLPFEILYENKINEYYEALIGAYSNGGSPLTWVNDLGETGTYTLSDLLGSNNYEVSEGVLKVNGEILDETDFKELIAVGQFPLHLCTTYTSEGVTINSWQSKLDVNDYIELTLEPRYAYNDEDDYRTQMYLPMRKAIREIYNAAISQTDTIFRDTFKNYFDYNYCLTYYLQMMLFAQVDNAGKNAMFDIWGIPDTTGDFLASKCLNSKFGKFYPRPYDMDTQMGLNNSGLDTIPVIAEITSELSKSQCTGDMATTYSSTEYLSNWASSVLGTDKTGANTAARFKTFNTSNSFLWKSFGKFFADEIKEAYAYLRDLKIYDSDFICSFVDEITSQRIGEKFFNQDASTKYFSFKSSKRDQLAYEESLDSFTGNAADLEKIDYYHQYLYCISGNRKNRYRQFLTDRIAFLDSYFNYSSMNDAIEVRYGIDTDLAVTGTTKKLGETTYVALGISVHKPTYISIDAASSNALYTVLVTPEDTYKLTPTGEPQEGVLFWLPAISDTGDTELYIRGCENIKELKHLPSLNPRKLLLSPSKKLAQLDLANCDHLAEFSVNTSKMSLLQTLNLSGTSSLSMGSVDLSACTNLVELRASGTKIAEFKLPNNNNLMTVDLSNNTALTSLSIVGNDLLTFETLNISNCPSLRQLALQNCSNLISNSSQYLGKATTNAVSGSTQYYVLDTKQLTSLSLINCPKITHLNLSTHNQLASCILQLPTLKTLDCSASQGAMFIYDSSNTIQYPGLDLTACTALESLNLSSIIPPVNTATQFSVVRVSDNMTHNVSINLYSSQLNTFTTKSSYEAGTYDFEGLVNTTVNLQLNKAIKKLQNFTQTITQGNFFNACTSLRELQACTLTVTGSGASSLYTGCSALESLGITNGTTIRFENCTSGNNTCYNCSKLNYDDLKYLAQGITAAGATSMSGFARAWGTKLASTITIGSDFFMNTDTANTTLTNLNNCFRGATMIAEVEQPLKNLTNLTNVDALFRGCTKLTKVNSKLFVNNNNIVYASYAFADCTSLKDIFNSSETSFFNSAKLTIIDGLFKNCAELNAPADGFSNFFEKIPGLKYARLAFYGCSNLDKLANNLFSNNNQLITIDGLFANSMSKNKVRVPVSLGLTPQSKLVSARGLFSGCSKLYGLVFADFFADSLGNAVATLEHIGSATTTDTQTLNSLTSNNETVSGVALLGCFAGTSINGCDSALLSNMTNLKKCSALFCSASVSTDTCNTIKTQTTFKGFIDETILSIDDNQSLIDQLKNELEGLSYDVQGCTDLEILKYAQQYLVSNDSYYGDLTYNTNVPLNFFTTHYSDGVPQGPEKIDLVFAGLSNITGIEYTDTELIELDETAVQEYHTTKTFIPDNVISAAGLFSKTGLTAAPHSIFTSDTGRKLENINRIFAGCSKLKFKLTKDTFKNCTALRQASAVFMNTKLQSGAINNEAAVPATLFDDCRGTLQNVSYMFANCKELVGYIGTGYAEINNETELTAKYSAYLKTSFNTLSAEFNKFTNANSYKYKDSDTAESMQKGFFVDYFTRLLDLSGDETVIESQVITHINNLCSTATKDCPNSDPLQSYIAYSLNGYSGDTAIYWETLLRNSTTQSYEKYKQNPQYRTYTIVQKGLLGDCTNLTSVAGMFLNCHHLYGPIPADMFTCSTGKSISLTSLDFLFCGCSRLASYVQDYSTSLAKLIDCGTIKNTLATEEDEPVRVLHATAGNYKNVYPSVIIEEGEKSYYLVNSTEDTQLLDSVEQAQYFVPEDWLESVKNIQSLNHTFSQIGTFQLLEQDEDGTNLVSSGEGGNGYVLYIKNFVSSSALDSTPEGYPLRLILPTALFKGKSTIKSACYTFLMNFAIGNSDSIIDNTFMSASVLNSLEQITGIFAGSSLQKITTATSADPTKCFLYSADSNTKLKNVTDAFAYMNTIDHSIGWTTDGSVYTYSRIPTTQMSGLTIVDLADSTKFKVLTTPNRAVRGLNVLPYYKYNGSSYISAGGKYDPYISGGVGSGGHAWWSIMASSRSAANSQITTQLNNSFNL